MHPKVGCFVLLVCLFLHQKHGECIRHKSHSSPAKNHSGQLPESLSGHILCMYKHMTVVPCAHTYKHIQVRTHALLKEKKKQMKICPTFCSHLKALLLGHAGVPRSFHFISSLREDVSVVPTLGCILFRLY